jgi:DNA-binding CsgD family transcriptional regulator
MVTADGVALVEAGYRFEPDDDAWVRGIAEAFASLIDDDQGMAVSFYDTSDASGVRIIRKAQLRAPNTPAEVAEVTKRVPASQLARLFPPVPLVGWLSQTFGKTAEGRKVVGLTSRFGEVMGVTCPSIARRGLVLSVYSPEPRTKKVATTTWIRLGTHLSHAARLRETLGKTQTQLDAGGDGAVLSADGTVVHAEGAARSFDARQALRDAARAVDRARCDQHRKDPEAALLSWKGLVEGRWSLVDQFDSDGRRFLVARRNDPAFRRPRALSRRERHVAALAAVGHPSKVIAYQLGISSAAAAATLTRALHKLGLHSRAELATVAGVLDPWGGASMPTPEGDGG